jgi:hypothetical protein
VIAGVIAEVIAGEPRGKLLIRLCPCAQGT